MPENFIAGQWVAAHDGGRREIRCPADGELVAEIDESTVGGHRGRDRRGARGLRRRRLAGHQCPRARRPAAARGRPAPARQGRARPDGVARHRQAPGRERDRHRRRDQRLPPLRPGGRRRGRSGGRHGHALGGQPRRPRARRGLRPDHAVELPAAAGVLEGRPGARRRLHVRAQAQRALAAHRHPPDAPPGRGRTACGRRQPGRRRRTATREHRSARTRASTSSPSPAGSAPASGSWPRPPAP